MFQHWFSGRATRQPTKAKAACPSRRRPLGLGLAGEALESRALLSAVPIAVAALTPSVEVSFMHAVASSASSSSSSGGGASSSSAAESLQIVLPQNVTNGSEVTVQVIALTASNRVAAGDSDSLTLATSDTGATIPASVTLVHGRGSFEMVFTTAGSETVTATDSAASLTATGATNVGVADTATHFVINAPANAPNGVAISLTIVAEDAQNFAVSSYSGTVALTSTDAAATLPATVTFVHGKATVQVTFNTAGQQTLTATDSATSTLSGSAITNVAAPDVATHYEILSAPAAVGLQGPVAAGAPVVFSVIALDAQNHAVSSYDGKATVTSTNATDNLPGSVTFTHGVALFRVTFGASGADTLTLTDSSSSTIVGSLTLTVAAARARSTTGGSTVTAASATSSTGSSTAAAASLQIIIPQDVINGSEVTVQVVALSASNKIASGDSDSLTLTTSDTTATIPSSVTLVNGRGSFEMTFGAAGTQTVTATDSTTLLTATGTTSVGAVDTPTHFAVILPPNAPGGVAIKATLVAEDAQNYAVSGYSGAVTLTSTDTVATLPSTVTFVNGVATVQITLSTPGQQTITATDNTTSTLTGSAITYVAAPDTATHYEIDAQGSAAAGSPATFAVVALDALNHPVTSYGGTAAVSSTNSTDKLPTSVTFANGVAKFQVTFGASGSDTLTLTDSSSSTLVGSLTLTVAAAGSSSGPTAGGGGSLGGGTPGSGSTGGGCGSGSSGTGASGSGTSGTGSSGTGSSGAGSSGVGSSGASGSGLGNSGSSGTSSSGTIKPSNGPVTHGSSGAGSSGSASSGTGSSGIGTSGSGSSGSGSSGNGSGPVGQGPIAGGKSAGGSCGTGSSGTGSSGTGSSSSTQATKGSTSVGPVGAPPIGSGPVGAPPLGAPPLGAGPFGAGQSGSGSTGSGSTGSGASGSGSSGAASSGTGSSGSGLSGNGSSGTGSSGAGSSAAIAVSHAPVKRR